MARAGVSKESQPDQARPHSAALLPIPLVCQEHSATASRDGCQPQILTTPVQGQAQSLLKGGSSLQ